MGLKIFLALSFSLTMLLLCVIVLNHFDDRDKNLRMQVQISRMASNDSIRIKKDKIFRDSLLSVVNRQSRIITAIQESQSEIKEKVSQLKKKK